METHVAVRRDFSGHNPFPSGRAGEVRRLSSSLRVPATGRMGQKVYYPLVEHLRGGCDALLRQVVHFAARDHQRWAVARHGRRMILGRPGAFRGRLRMFPRVDALPVGLHQLLAPSCRFAAFTAWTCQRIFSLSRVRGAVSAPHCETAMDYRVQDFVNYVKCLVRRAVEISPPKVALGRGTARVFHLTVGSLPRTVLSRGLAPY